MLSWLCIISNAAERTNRQTEVINAFLIDVKIYLKRKENRIINNFAKEISKAIILSELESLKIQQISCYF